AAVVIRKHRRTRSMLSGGVLVGGRPERGSSLIFLSVSIKRFKPLKTHFFTHCVHHCALFRVCSVDVLPNLKQNLMFTHCSFRSDTPSHLTR
ncbi:hypothetical protein AVEN_122099-1, partial [Araneus ventricosus]